MQTCSFLTGTTVGLRRSLFWSCNVGLCDNCECDWGFDPTGALPLASDDFSLRGSLALLRCCESMRLTSPNGLRCVTLDGADTPVADILAPSTVKKLAIITIQISRLFNAMSITARCQVKKSENGHKVKMSASAQFSHVMSTWAGMQVTKYTKINVYHNFSVQVKDTDTKYITDKNYYLASFSPFGHDFCRWKG